MKPSDVRRARKRAGHVSKLYRRRAQFHKTSPATIRDPRQDERVEVLDRTRLVDRSDPKRDQSSGEAPVHEAGASSYLEPGQ